MERIAPSFVQAIFFQPSDVNAFAASGRFMRWTATPPISRIGEPITGRAAWGSADRYTTSNAVHQGSKLQGTERTDFFDWLFDYEYRLLGLPKPDMVIYLDVPGGSDRAKHAPERKRKPAPPQTFMSGMTAICGLAGWLQKRLPSDLAGRILPAQRTEQCAPLRKFMRMFTVP